MQEGDLVVEPAQIAVFAHGGAAEGIAADKADIRLGIVIECGERLHRNARKRLDISRIHGNGTGDGHLAVQLDLAGEEKFADGGGHQRGDGPDGLALADGGDVADLDTDVAGGVFARNLIEGDAFQFVERGAGGLVAIDADVDTAFGQFTESDETGLDGGHLASEDEVGIGSKRGGVESRHENGLRLQGRIGDDAVGTLDEGRPQAAGEDGLAHLVGAQCLHILHAEVHILPLLVRFHDHGKQFSLFAPDNSLNRTAHG